MDDIQKLRTWIEIDKKALKDNFQAFKKLINKKTKLACVVKSNAYGHGLIPFSKEVQGLGADFLCVDDIDEALTLREGGISIPILILGYIPLPRLKEAVGKNISITISNFETLEQAKDLNLKIHIKVDTGLGRQGFLERERDVLIGKLLENEVKAEGLYSHFATKYRNLEIEGLYSHFANSENPKSDYSEKQVKVFQRWIEAFEKEEIKSIKHISASAATMIWPKFHFDMVRIGISMCGLWPSKESREPAERKIKLSPVLSWKSKIIGLKELKKGQKVGYDLAEELKRDSKLAIIPVGYWYGYDRGLSGIGRVFIKGKPAKVIGRVAMCMIVVDITDIYGAKIKDEVILLGKEETAEDIAKKIGTINYEIVTRINQIIPRIYN